jgi:hypothetical protein
MSIEYLGFDTNTLHLQPGSIWGRTEEGLDTLSELYAGPKPAEKQWQRDHLLSKVHLLYPSMYLVSNLPNEGRSYTFVELMWIGVRNGGAIPDPVVARRMANKSASNSAEFDHDEEKEDEQISREVSYIAPEIVFSYATDKETLDPQYDPYGEIPNVSGTILRDIITDSNGVRYSGSAPSGMVSALSMVPAWRAVGMESIEIRYTPYWANQEVWAYEFPQG